MKVDCAHGRHGRKVHIQQNFIIFIGKLIVRMNYTNGFQEQNSTKIEKWYIWEKYTLHITARWKIYSTNFYTNFFLPKKKSSLADKQ